MANTRVPMKTARIPYTMSRIANIAYLAGKGCSGPEIAAALGMKTGHVYWLLFENRIPLAPKTAADIAFPVVLPKRALANAETLSKELAMPPDWMMTRLLEAVLAERNVAINLLDGVKPPGE